LFVYKERGISGHTQAYFAIKKIRVLWKGVLVLEMIWKKTLSLYQHEVVQTITKQNTML
jgi:hypothetical protein